MSHPLVTISILSYNDERTIETAVKSAALQLYPAIEILVLDNNSKDATREILKGLRDRLPSLRRSYLRDNGVADEVFRYHILESAENTGFAKGHNRIIATCQGSYILLLNSDAGLDDQFVAHALPYFDKDEKLAAIQGKLYRFDPDTEEPVIDESSGKPVIDTTGLVILKNRRIINRGQGTPDLGQFGEDKEVFGPDGAAPLFRKAALEDIKVCLGVNPQSSVINANPRCEYLDEDFFAYKEDVDLAWRLRLAGWTTLYAANVIGYHQRGSGESAATSYVKIMGERRKLSRFAKYHAFKNQRLMQIKDEFPGLLLRHFFHWAPKEIGSWIYVLLFERFTWKAFGDIFRLSSKMLKKRRIVMKKRRVGYDEIAKWLS